MVGWMAWVTGDMVLISPNECVCMVNVGCTIIFTCNYIRRFSLVIFVQRWTKRNAHHYQYVLIFGFNSMLPIHYCYAGDRILRQFGLMLCLLMHRLLKSPVHQQAWYLLSRRHNRYCCSRIYMIYSGSSEIQHKKVKMGKHIFKFENSFSMLKAKIG